MFRKIVFNGLTEEEFEEVFPVEKKTLESKNDAIFRVVMENFGEKKEIQSREEKKAALFTKQ